MRDEYNIGELNPRKNSYTNKVKVTIAVDGSTVDYFKSMAAADGIPYQTLMGSDLGIAEMYIHANTKIVQVSYARKHGRYFMDRW